MWSISPACVDAATGSPRRFSIERSPPRSRRAVQPRRLVAAARARQIDEEGREARQHHGDDAEHEEDAHVGGRSPAASRCCRSRPGRPARRAARRAECQRQNRSLDAQRSQLPRLALERRAVERQAAAAASDADRRRRHTPRRAPTRYCRAAHAATERGQHHRQRDEEQVKRRSDISCSAVLRAAALRRHGDRRADPSMSVNSGTNISTMKNTTVSSSAP